MNVRKRSGVQKEIRDYIVPIVGLVLILVLIFSIFSGGNEPSGKINIENKVGIELNLNGSNAESYIVYPGDYKKKVEGDISLYKGEKILVKEGSITLAMIGLGNIELNKLGELKYLENGDFLLSSSDLWLNAVSGVNINMRFASVKVGANSNISFSQNEVGSTVYLLNGFAEVENQAGVSTVLAGGQKITVTRLDANKSDIDLSILKSDIDDYYKQSDWFIKNNGSSFLNSIDIKEETSTGTKLSSITTNNTSNNSFISFNNLSDELNVSSDSITINGNINNMEVTKITLNGTLATINTEKKSFIFEKVSVSDKENDLVFKVYDDANDIISKFFYTVYFDGASVKATSNSKFKVQTFNVDGSQFVFTNIKDGVIKKLSGKTSYTTYGDFLTFYGNVTAKGISKVSVNGYTLKSFNGSTWRYHASVNNNNLNLGTNLYEVKYFDVNGKGVYTNYFTIIQKTIKDTKDKKIISDEVTIN